MRGHNLDAARLRFRKVPNNRARRWPPNTNMLETKRGNIRVRDTGGNKPVVVLVPDGPCVIEHYDALIGELVDSFRVICFDLPGFGFSYPAHGYDFGLDQTAEVVMSVLDALDVAKATLSFSCANGFYALATALAHPSRVERLVLCQTPSASAMHKWVLRNVPRALRIPVVGQATAAMFVGTLTDRWFDAALPRDSLVKKDFCDLSLAALGAGACFCLASVVQGLKDVPNLALRGVQVPTTVIWGNKDWSHKNTDFEGIRELVPNCTIELFEGCGHFPDLERPKEFAQRVKQR